MKQKKLSLFKKVLLGIVILLVLLAGAFFWYVSDYYRAEDIAVSVLAQDDGITFQDNLTILLPFSPTDTAVIFYPGAKVEAIAYLPLLDQIRQTPVFWSICPFTWRFLTQMRRRMSSRSFRNLSTGTSLGTPWAVQWPHSSLPPTIQMKSTASSCSVRISTAIIRSPTRSPFTARSTRASKTNWTTPKTW